MGNESFHQELLLVDQCTFLWGKVLCHEECFGWRDTAWLLDGKLYVNILCIIKETGFAVTRGGVRCCLRDRMWNTKSEFKKKKLVQY